MALGTDRMPLLFSKGSHGEVTYIDSQCSNWQGKETDVDPIRPYLDPDLTEMYGQCFGR